MSNDADETEEGMLGNSLPHCVGLIIFLLLSDCSAVLFRAKTACRVAGAYMESKVSLRAWVLGSCRLC